MLYIYIYVCVCMYVCISIYSYVHTYMYIYIYPLIVSVAFFKTICNSLCTTTAFHSEVIPPCFACGKCSDDQFHFLRCPKIAYVFQLTPAFMHIYKHCFTPKMLLGWLFFMKFIIFSPADMVNPLIPIIILHNLLLKPDILPYMLLFKIGYNILLSYSLYHLHKYVHTARTF